MPMLTTSIVKGADYEANAARTSAAGIAVIIPCYNAENNLRRTIDSLFDQDCLPDEIIVVDDGSGDSTAQIARSYGGIVKVVGQENSGAAAARYRGVREASSEIVAFLDAGDTATRSKIRLLKAALVQNPDCVCAFGIAWNTCKSKPAESKITLLPLDETFTVVDDPFKFMLAHYWPIVAAMDLAIWRDVALQSVRIPEFYQAGNDYAVQIKTATFGSFVHVSAITTEFVFLPQGLSSRFGLSLQIGFALCASVEAFELSPDPNTKHILKDRVIRDLPRGLIAAYLRKNWPLFRRLIAIQRVYGVTSVFPRRLWWALKEFHYRDELEHSWILRNFVRVLLTALGPAKKS